LYSTRIHLAGKTLRPLLILGFRAGAFRHSAGEFPLRHLARQVGGLALGFCLFSCSTPWSTSSSTMTSSLRTSRWRKKLRLPRLGPSTALCLVLLLCTLRGSTPLHRRPERQGLRLGRCLQPGNCCATLLAPRPRWGPRSSGVTMSTVCSTWRILAQPGPGLGHPGVNMRRRRQCAHPR
jgi:hypothetical protein